MKDDIIDIDTAMVQELIDTQFPQYSNLPLLPIDPQGWDNRTYRLGEQLSVRLPSARRYAAQVEKEQTWLPRLAPGLPFAIPAPIAKGRPSENYFYTWSIMEWIPGTMASVDQPLDFQAIANDAASFLKALHRLDASNGPLAGPHNFFRGGSLQTYDEETRTALADLNQKVDTGAVIEVWNAALSSQWDHESVWVHGDFAPSNLIVAESRLKAVIDFGGLGVGDPACDLVLTWTFLPENCRQSFRNSLALDKATWARARGWAVWKALLILTERSEQKFSEHPAVTVLESVLQDHRQEPAQ
ncbi:MAG: aminoglycoside phosphotransferase family protein [Stappiaceae bacterium]